MKARKIYHDCCGLYRKQRVICIEGPDGAGKTTTAQALSELWLVPTYKMPKDPTSWGDNSYLNALRHDHISDFLEQVGSSVIFDRCYPTEWVYSQAYSRPTDMGVLRARDELFTRMGAGHLILLRHEYLMVDDWVHPSMTSKLHDLYLQFADWTRCSVKVVYADGMSTMQVCEAAAQVLL